jgi:hypothetical protein
MIELLLMAWGHDEMSGARRSHGGARLLGAKAAYVGKVQDYQLGAVFRHDIRATGVDFRTPPLRHGPPPPASRSSPKMPMTMATCACVSWGPPRSTGAGRRGRTSTSRATSDRRGQELVGRPRSPTPRPTRGAYLSDPFCVDRGSRIRRPDRPPRRHSHRNEVRPRPTAPTSRSADMVRAGEVAALTWTARCW